MITRSMLAVLGLLASLAVAPRPVAAALIARQPALCPCCGQELSMPIVADADSKGGVDRDFFARSGGGQQQVYYWVVTCPKCLFSGYPAEFVPPGGRVPALTRAQQALVRRAVSPMAPRLPVVAPDGDILKFSGQQRYELAYRIAAALGRDDEALAWIALRLAWCYRQEGANVRKRERYQFMLQALVRAVPDPPDHNAADRGVRMAELATSPREVAGEALADRLVRRFYGAVLYRRHGELVAYQQTMQSVRTEMRQAVLDAQQQLAVAVTQPASRPAPDAGEDAVTTTLAAVAAVQQDQGHVEATVGDEQHWLAVAAEHFERALVAGQITDQNQNRALATYLVGELHRRLGRRELALQWFEKAAQLELPPDAAKWLKGQQARAGEIPDGWPAVPRPTLPLFALPASAPASAPATTQGAQP